jgi:serine/threonine protein kinase
MSERSIFLAALDKASEGERRAYLDQACAGAPELRTRVEALLRSHERMGSFLEGPLPQTRAGVQDSPREDGQEPVPPAAEVLEADTRIGPYKLLEKIGEGGMGVVYRVEQETPVRRQVALKIIKPGMASAQVIARFEAERQALALMEHSRIARVLDAGTTETGRPYFVMELVKGVPITAYCDAHHLGVRERLALFVPVCQAIQHAHQKGIIHRDLKPSNVLITLQEEIPAPKVIDFGVAKALGQGPGQRALDAEAKALVGTLEYMSPEQAGWKAAEDIDTRSDIYALGVLLYKLLTGSTPLAHQRPKDAGFLETLRIICEDRPAPPSAFLSAAPPAARAEIAALRRADPRKLASALRGELDWIVMKCLDKDRARPYETVSALIRDMGSHLRNEPVEACPPAARYRMRKFAARHRKLLLTAAAFMALLLAGAAASVWVAVQAKAADWPRTSATGPCARKRKRGPNRRAPSRRSKQRRRSATAQWPRNCGPTSTPQAPPPSANSCRRC